MDINKTSSLREGERKPAIRPGGRETPVQAFYEREPSQVAAPPRVIPKKIYYLWRGKKADSLPHWQLYGRRALIFLQGNGWEPLVFPKA